MYTLTIKDFPVFRVGQLDPPKKAGKSLLTIPYLKLQKGICMQHCCLVRNVYRLRMLVALRLGLPGWASE